MHHFVVPVALLRHAIFINFMLSVEFLQEQGRKEKNDDRCQTMRHVDKRRFGYQNECDNSLIHISSCRGQRDSQL